MCYIRYQVLLYLINTKSIVGSREGRWTFPNCCSLAMRVQHTKPGAAAQGDMSARIIQPIDLMAWKGIFTLLFISFIFHQLHLLLAASFISYIFYQLHHSQATSFTCYIIHQLHHSPALSQNIIHFQIYHLGLTPEATSMLTVLNFAAPSLLW